MPNKPIPASFCYVAILLSFGISFALYGREILSEHTFYYVPLVLLIACHTLYAVLADREQYVKRSWKRIIPKVIGKYIMWGLVIWGVLRFYGAHPLYREFAINTRRFFEHFLRAYAFAGIPYFLLAERLRYSVDNALGDPYLRLISLLKALLKGRFRQAWGRLCRRPYRRLYLMSILRIHYAPIMLEQVHAGTTTLVRLMNGSDVHWSLSSVLPAVIALAWLIDSNNASMGYFWESQFTKTRFRDIDPYPLHWFVTLICYVPFVGCATQFVPFPNLPDYSAMALHHAGLNMAIEIALVTALVLYMLSGSALAFNTSNLCYKKIQTRGPYGIVRHPATICKLAYFALAFFRYRDAYTWAGLLCFLFWTTVYICRALAEERFLRRFVEYRAYMRKTRYRFIPWLC